MLEIVIPEREWFDERSSRILRFRGATITLEHSLLSISKWESIWEVPFLTDTKKSPDQLKSYVELMVVGEAPTNFTHQLSKENLEQINKYIEAKHSATWFSEDPSAKGSHKTVTSELVYYWMTAFNVPFECENWQFSRLMNLLKIAMIKQEEQTKKKSHRSRSQMLSERSALNAKRLKEAQDGRSL